ncbi:MAG TPA: glycosyltransferase family 4 protein [Caldimonas sp.]|nr:glycosyltransferase family 4 protein [Caldimonas sp.]HEX2541259.1 glycosyltransferase family 4 protein [Caldimonas sp.]
MRILIISDVSGYMRGGVPEECRQLANGMHSRAHAVAYCGDLPIPSRADVRHFPLSLESVQRLQASVAVALVSFQPDLVHVLAMSSRGLHALRPALKSRPWLLTCHSIPPHERSLRALHGNDWLHYFARDLRFFPHGLAWRMLLTRRLVPKIVTHSGWVSDIVHRYGYPRARTHEIPLGRAPGTGSSRSPSMTPVVGSPRLVTIGGIAHTKGHHDAVRAIASLRSDFPDLSYQIIGQVRDRSYMSYLVSLIQGAGLSAHVTLRTDVDEAAKQQALASADLYLQPSHEEGFCLAYIEAASQVPRLVGTATGAIRRVSQDDPGMQVVPPGRPSELASAIRLSLREALPTDLMALRARRLDRDFSWRAYLDEHENLYDELVDAWFVPQLSTA